MAFCHFGNHVFHIFYHRISTWLSQSKSNICHIPSVLPLNLKPAENGEIEGSIGGCPTSAANKIWLISQALGDVAFGFTFPLVFLEIMDTLKTNPPEKVTMKKASVMAICMTTFFYLCCGALGYAAFGNSTSGNLLTGFGFYEPHWLIDFADVCIVLHLVGGYQVYTQLLYASIEQWFRKRFPSSRFVHGDLANASPESESSEVVFPHSLRWIYCRGCNTLSIPVQSPFVQLWRISL